MARRHSRDAEMLGQTHRHPSCQFRTDKPWLDLQFNDNGTVKTPDELRKEMKDTEGRIDKNILSHIYGSMIGMALGDALGAHVEFRPHAFLAENPVTSLEGGGTWGLQRGQFTDDTSMALCLASSLISRRDYVPYDQLVRYKWWHRNGYMSSTGKCFDIGAATKHSLVEFEQRQKEFAGKHGIPLEDLDYLSNPELLNEFKVDCSEDGVAGNGALMRLTPVPLFFYKYPESAVDYSGHSGFITHGDDKAVDACRYYGALIVAAVHGETKDQLLDENFYEKHIDWFKHKPLHADIEGIARGSYREKKGYEGGIRGKGYIVSALQAALWAFWSDDNSFEKGVLAAVNLGDDTDTTAAIYGQLAGAYYGFDKLPTKWVKEVYAKEFIEYLSKWIYYEGMRWSPKESNTTNIRSMIVEQPSNVDNMSSLGQNTVLYKQQLSESNRNEGSQSSKKGSNSRRGSNSTLEPNTSLLPETRTRGRTYNDVSDSLKPCSNDQSRYARPQSAERYKVYSSENLKTCKDVCHWLRTLGKEYMAYWDPFTRHRVDGYWLLNQVNAENLKRYGVEHPDHQQTILNEIEKLKRTKCDVNVVQDYR